MTANAISTRSKTEDEESEAEDELIKSQLPENRLWQKVSSRYNARTISSERLRRALQINSEGYDSTYDKKSHSDHEVVDADTFSKSTSSNALSHGSPKDQTEISEELTPLEHLLSNVNMNGKYVYQDKTNELSRNADTFVESDDYARKNGPFKNIGKHFVIGFLVKSFIKKILSKSRRTGRTFKVPTNSDESISLSLYSDYNPITVRALRIHEVPSNAGINNFNATDTQKNLFYSKTDNFTFGNSVFLNYAAKVESQKSRDKRLEKEKKAQEKKEKKEQKAREKKERKEEKKKEKKGKSGKKIQKGSKGDQDEKDKKGKKKKTEKIKASKPTSGCNKSCVHKKETSGGQQQGPIKCKCDYLPVLEDYNAKKGQDPKSEPSKKDMKKSKSKKDEEPDKKSAKGGKKSGTGGKKSGTGGKKSGKKRKPTQNYRSYSRKRIKSNRSCCQDRSAKSDKRGGCKCTIL